MAKKKKARKKSRRVSIAALVKRIAKLEKRERALEKEQRRLRKQLRGVRKKKKKAAKKKKKAPTKKELKTRGTDPRQLPRLGISRDYRGGFKPFLERVDKRPRGRHRAYAIVRVVLLDYADSPTRDLSIFLGEKTTKELKQFTNRQLLARAPGKWGRLGADSQVLFIAKLKGGKFRGDRPDKIRSKIAKTNKRARSAIAAENIRRRESGQRFHEFTR